MTHWIRSHLRSLSSIPIPGGFELAWGLGLGVVVFVSVYHSAWWVLIALMVLRMFWMVEPLEHNDIADTKTKRHPHTRRRSRFATVAGQPRRTWHFAQVQYEYRKPERPHEVLVDHETVQVYGKCEDSALLSLRKLYPQREGLRVRSITRHFTNAPSSAHQN